MRAIGPLSAFAATAILCGLAAARDPIKIGLITTLSGPAGYLGQGIRDGFQLAVDLKGGPFEGLQVQVMSADDGMKPGQAKQIADGFLKSNDVKIFTGVLFGNIAFAVVPDILEANAIYVSANTAAAASQAKAATRIISSAPGRTTVRARVPARWRRRSGTRKPS
jgi:branched-chain amino acid transport system substrate-binding protein